MYYGYNHELVCDRCGRKTTIPDSNGPTGNATAARWTTIPNGDETVTYCPECSRKLL